MTPASPSAPPSRRSRFLVPALIYLVHLGLVAYAWPLRVLAGGEPVMGIDYQTHFEQARTVSEAISRFGRTWAYDPYLLAGQPAGLLFDVDNMAHSLFTHGLSRLGLDQALAFNLFVLLSHLLAPLAVWLAARLFRTGFRAEMISLALGVLLWHFDSAPRWCWWAGMISYVTVGYGSAAAIALFHRLVERAGPPARPPTANTARPGPAGGLHANVAAAAKSARGLPGGGKPAGPWERGRFLLPLLVLLPLLLCIHAWAFVTLVVPLVGLYLRQARAQGAAGHLRVWGLATFALVANLFWLWPALRHFDLIAASAKVGQATPLHLLADYLDIFISPLQTGSVATRTLFRFAAFAAAALTLWRWRRERDPRFFSGALTLGWLLGLAYGAALMPLLRETEPYRFIVPAIFVAAVFAGPTLDRILRRDWLRGLSPAARWAGCLLLVVATPRLVQQVTYFIPELLPRPEMPPVAAPNVAGPRSLAPLPEFTSFRHNPIPGDYREVAAYLRESCKEEGRVLVEWWVLGEYLRWSTALPIIGGFPDRRMIFEGSNLFRYRDDERYRGQELADYLVRYNIRYVVITNLAYPFIEQRRELLEPLRFIGMHRLYRVRHLGDYFASGSGKVKAALNRIEVDESRPAEGTEQLVLRFHHLRSLRCSPSCRLEPWPLPDSRASFIRVLGAPRLPRRFVIENSY